MALKSVYL